MLFYILIVSQIAPLLPHSAKSPHYFLPLPSPPRPPIANLPAQPETPNPMKPSSPARSQPHPSGSIVSHIRNALLLGAMICGSSAVFGQSGTAFRDYNGNGTKDGAGEPGVTGIIVKLYANATPPLKDQLIGTDTTNASGVYNFATPDSGRAAIAGEKVRIEFTVPASADCGKVANTLDFASRGASAYGSSVQFATGPASGINFALNYAGEYVEDSAPDIYTTCYVNGNPLAGGTSGTLDALVKVGFDGTNMAHLATASQIGSTYGLAFSKQAKKLFVSAVMRRHCGFGPLGAGGIYMVDPATSAVTNFLNLDAIGIATSDTSGTYAGNISASATIPFSPVIGTNVQRGLSVNAASPQADAAAFDQPGKLSLGDTDISDDGRYLYTVNLWDRKLYQIDLGDSFNPTAPYPCQCRLACEIMEHPRSRNYFGTGRASSVWSGRISRSCVGRCGAFRSESGRFERGHCSRPGRLHLQYRHQRCCSLIPPGSHIPNELS